MLFPFRCLKCAWAGWKAPLRMAKVSVGEPASKELGHLRDWFPRSRRPGNAEHVVVDAER